MANKPVLGLAGLFLAAGAMVSGCQNGPSRNTGGMQGSGGRPVAQAQSGRPGTQLVGGQPQPIGPGGAPLTMGSQPMGGGAPLTSSPSGFSPNRVNAGNFNMSPPPGGSGFGGSPQPISGMGAPGGSPTGVMPAGPVGAGRISPDPYPAPGAGDFGGTPRPLDTRNTAPPAMPMPAPGGQPPLAAPPGPSL
jgi:hypothetical protein